MFKKLIFNLPIIFLVSCGAGSGTGLDNQGLPMSSAASDQNSSQSTNQTSGVTLNQLQQNIFGAICINCHVGSTAPHGLRLDSEDNTYAFLIYQASAEVSNMLRVYPGQPDESYIIRKLEGASGIVGGRMPLGGPYLEQAQINQVRQWISEGAPRTGTGTAQ